MTRFEIIVKPFGSLYIGGYAQAIGGSDGETASDSLSLLLPGSAVKGALREAAVRLVEGAGKGKEILGRLFGAPEEPENHKDRMGILRVGTLRPHLAGHEDLKLGAVDGTLRNHVSLERTTRQAVPQQLFQNRVTPALPGLRFRGVLESREPLNEEELGLLRAAVRITDQLGGGRGRGLGMVEISLTEAATVEPEPEPGLEVGEATEVMLVLQAEEPLHLSSVKDPSNYTPTRDYLEGSAVRGAVAAALAGLATKEELDMLLGGQSPAAFGDGRPGSQKAIPAPMTLKGPKGSGDPCDEAALLCAGECGGRLERLPEDFRTVKGSWVLQEKGWAKFSVKVRTVTRNARDHASGRGEDGKLFSLEVLDPVLEPEKKTAKDPAEEQVAPKQQRLCFYVPVKGTPEQIALTIRAARAGLVVGGDRTRGYGRLRLLKARTEPVLAPLEKRHALWAELIGRLGVPDPESTGVLMALGPLAVSHERLVAAIEAAGLELLHGAVRRQTNGGWNARIHLQRSISSHVLPGSILIVRQKDRRSALPALAELETKGIGPGRPDGWGRLVACHPIHVDCFKEGKPCPR
jgi:CRISPR/Cas system CSM-associated protein Csm3 (group 7 of RAMP superfamily)